MAKYHFVHPIRGGSRAAATSKMECFVIIVNGFQPLTIITKHSILDVAAVLDPPLSILFALTLACEGAVLHRNIALSILVLSTKKLYSSFLKKVFLFQKICFKVKVLKSFKISSGCHIKTCRSLKRRAILKISITVFKKNLCSFC